ncbi:MAG TPA: iron-containing alcohol dehydrogenase, partial [Geobacteraceae bacterium]|nr:iron-containing alcohol dehydrogenase [Geobacteraceae bacterium]
DINALKAIELLTRNLPQVVVNGSDVDARTGMLLGSMLAGFAYNSAILGLAHSISHPLTVHCGLSHGIANAAVLPHVMRFNASAVSERIRNIGISMGLNVQGMPTEEAVELTISAIADLSRRIGIPTLKEAEVSREAFDVIATDALKEISTIFNPRNPKKEDVLRILENAWQ